MMHKDESGSYLTKEELHYIEETTIRAPDEDLTYATVFPIERIPNPNATSHEYFIAEDDEGAAELVNVLEDAPGLAVSNSRVTYAVQKIKLKAGLAVEDIETSRSWNVPLNVETLNRVKRKVDEKTNSLAYVGDTKFGIPGVISGSGFTAITGTNWGSAGLDLANEVITYMNSIPRIYRKRPYTLVVADTEWKRLQLYFNSSASVGDRNHFERIKAAFPNLDIVNETNMDAGTVLYDSSTVAAGVAFLFPKDKNLIKMTVAKAPYVLNENKIVDEKVNMAVASRVGIVEVPFPTAIGKITGLQG